MSRAMAPVDPRYALSRMKVALIGCGAVGSQLAQMLVHFGAGQHHSLKLFDEEILTIENIHRHFASVGDVGKNKAEATAAAISRIKPDVLLKVFTRNALYHWKEFESCDLVIDASGDWNTQSALNAALMYGGREDIKALLHAWTFLNGEASQCFLNLNDEYACFQCLRPDMDEHWRFPVRYEDDLINPRHFFFPRKDYPMFTDDHKIAASLAATAAVNWATENLCSRLSTVEFDESRPRGQLHSSPKPAKNCSVCSEIRRN